MSKVLKIFFINLGILILWLCISPFLSTVIGENAVNSVAAGIFIYFWASLFLLIVSVVWLIRNTAENVHASAQSTHMLHKLDHIKCKNVNEENLIILFKLSAKDLLNGEVGSKQKNANKIKNSINKCAVILGLDMIFCIDRENGLVYKVLQPEHDGCKSYYQIPYQELNRCIEMKEDLIIKYNVITESNWKIVAGIK